MTARSRPDTVMNRCRRTHVVAQPLEAAGDDMSLGSVDPKTALGMTVQGPKIVTAMRESGMAAGKAPSAARTAALRGRVATECLDV